MFLSHSLACVSDHTHYAFQEKKKLNPTMIAINAVGETNAACLSILTPYVIKGIHTENYEKI